MEIKKYFEKETWGVWTIRFLVLVPVIIWLFMKPLELRIGSSALVMTSIGQVTALMGIVAFALTLILSARIKWFEKYFGGLDKLYSVHHLLGVIAFLLLLVHPLALAGTYAQMLSLKDAALFLLPSSNWAINYGIMALYAMMVVIVITMFARRMRYEHLKNIHKTFGFIFFLGALHAFLIPSDISQSTLLRTYILGLSAIALLFYTYRTILGKYLVVKFTYRVVDVTHPANGVTEISMEPVGKKMEYEPGQFVFISFADENVNKGEVHPFSISSAPHEQVLKITIKALGDFSTKIAALSVGTSVRIEGPFGHFSYKRRQNKRQIWIAGGVGVTPFINMARDIAETKPQGYEVDFYYSVNTLDEMIHKTELESLQEKYPHFHFIPFPADAKGFLSADIIAQRSNGLFGKDIYICGPPPMMNNLIDQFRQGGIPRRRIHSEAFRML